MNNRLLKFSVLLLFIFLLSGCKKNELETGEIVCDSSYIYSGSFEEHVIDTSVIETDGFSLTTDYFSGDNNYFVLNSYDSISGASCYYYFSFTDSGKVLSNSKLSLPISVDDGRVVFSSDCKSITTRGESAAIYDNGNVNYFNFVIADDGSLSAVCRLDLTSFSVNLGRDVYVNDYYQVNWDDIGKLISVSDYVPSSDELNYYTNSFNPNKYFEGNDGNIYKRTSNGIVLVNSDHEYQSVYFDFINSGVSSVGFDFLNVKDSDSFSCIYVSSEGKSVLSCFSRKDDLNSSRKPIVFATSGLTRDIRNDIVSYNTSQKDYLISVVDYSDRSSLDDIYDGWNLLKADVLNGFSPDGIINMTGYDKTFEDMLVSAGQLLDLNDVIRSIPDIKDSGFSDKASSLFYSGKQIYSMVPYYSFSTVVGPVSEYGDANTVTLSDFISRYSSVVDDHTLFIGDSRVSFVKRTMIYNGLSYVNFTDKSTSFATNGFADLLQFASLLPADENAAIDLYYSESNGENVCLAEINCSRLGDFNLYAQKALKDNFCIIGFPGGGSSTGGVINADISFMIMSGHKYSNECWEFIKQYLDHDYQTSLSLGIPVTATGYEAWYYDRTTTTGDSSQLSYFREGQYCAVLNPSDDEADYIVSSISACNRFAFHDYEIEQIVLDYSNQFFDGKITAEDAARAIDADVQAYLNK